MKTTYSTEEYALTKWLRYGLTALFVIIAVLVIASHYAPIDAPGFNKPNLVTAIIIAAVMVVLALVAFFLKVSVEIDGSEIRVKCIRTKVIKKKDIESATIKEINPVKDYGGYGYRMKKGERGIITGDTHTGVYIVVRDQPNLFISCKEPERLLRAIQGQH